MNKEQLIEIRDVFNDIQRGITNPIKISAAYKHINDIEGMEVAQQVKIRAISRYCMLNYYEMETTINTVESEPNSHEYQEFNESIGTVENKPQHSHTEATADPNDDLSTFITKEEKEVLASPKSGTEFVIEKKRGNPNFGKKKN